MKIYEAIKIVLRKNTSKILFKVIAAFSIYFSISSFDMPKGMITITSYLQINLIYQTYMHVAYPELYLQDQIGVFF